MKIAIIYFNELQWTEQQLIHFFKNKGVKVVTIEAKDLSTKKVKGCDFVLNRVYASTANNNYFNFRGFIRKLKRLEDNGIKVINSSFSSMCDYSKYFATQIMKKNGILVPETERAHSVEEVKKFFIKNKGPIIFKPDTGGRGVGVCRIDSIKEISENLFLMDDTKSPNFIVQSLAKSMANVDYRVFVCRDEIICVNTRTLVDGWLGSRSQGSKIALIDTLPVGLKEIAVNTTRAIGAEINSMDIIQTSEGFLVIENNPTPNFDLDYIESFGFNPVGLMVNQLIKDHVKVLVEK